MTTRNEPVIAASAVLAALQVLVGGAALADVIGTQAAGLASLVVAALTVGLGVYTRGQVTPVNPGDPSPPAAAPVTGEG